MVGTSASESVPDFMLIILPFVIRNLIAGNSHVRFATEAICLYYITHASAFFIDFYHCQHVHCKYCLPIVTFIILYIHLFYITVLFLNDSKHICITDVLCSIVNQLIYPQVIKITCSNCKPMMHQDQQAIHASSSGKIVLGKLTSGRHGRSQYRGAKNVKAKNKDHTSASCSCKTDFKSWSPVLIVRLFQ